MRSDLPILNYNGNTYIPLRNVSESLGANVVWEKENNKVSITSPDFDENLIELVKTIPEQIEINDHKFTLKTKIWRDNMPVGEFYKDLLNEGTDLMLVQDNGQSFSEQLSIEKVWLINNDIVWKPDFMSSGTIIKEDENTIMMLHSPEFPPVNDSKTTFDVIVKIKDNNNNVYLLKAADQAAIQAS